MKSKFHMLTLATVSAGLLAVAAPLTPSALAQEAAPMAITDTAQPTTPAPAAAAPTTAAAAPITAAPITAAPITAVPISAPLPAPIASQVTVTSKMIESPSEIMKVTIQIPVVSGMTDTDYQQKLNERIEQQAMKDLETMKKESEEAVADAKKAGYEYRPYEVNISYETKSSGNAEDQGILSLEVKTYTYTGGAHGGTRADLYNAAVGGKEAADLTLEQALGEGGLAKADKAMREQFARVPNVFFADAVSSFKGVSPEQPFFVEQGVVNLVFQQYEIAPYAAGIVNIPVTEEGQAAPFVTIAANQTVKDASGAMLVPLRSAAEALGYKVEWRDETRSAELSRGNQWTSVTVGENSYFVNKMAPVSLSAAPVIINDTMLVPVEFFDSTLKLRVVTDASGAYGITG
ncbi:MAG: copper amine oxidase domain protein [Paenibacillus sp.]|jgi:hypothetical protein|nr:copper amine oxidase domain protein [Paenibacillus sp.]